MNFSHVVAVIFFSVFFAVLFTACSKVEERPAVPAPVTPLVYCHAQGGKVVNGQCVPHRKGK